MNKGQEALKVMFEWTTGSVILACAVFAAVIFFFMIGIRKEMEEKGKK